MMQVIIHWLSDMNQWLLSLTKFSVFRPFLLANISPFGKFVWKIVFSVNGRPWQRGKKKKKNIQMHLHFEIKEPSQDLALCLFFLAWKHKQTGGHETGTACAAYHRALRTAVLEAAGRFFVEAVVGSRGFGHLLHDHLGLHVLVSSGVYCDMGTLKRHEIQVVILVYASTT